MSTKTDSTMCFDVDKDGVGLEPTTLADAIDHAEGNGAFDDPADEVEAADLTGDSAEAADDSNDESDRPQPATIVELPEDFDWRKLTPRVYGKSLPPLDPVDRQNLKTSIESRGFLGRILIDELLNIIEGNTRWEISVETGIAPAVEMVSGLSEEEKEELALSCNVDRRQLKDDDAERKVREARLDNLLDARQKDSKKWTQTRIAEVLGVSIATVSLRECERHASKGETASKPDSRRLYGDDLKREAVRLVEAGMPISDVARLLPIGRKAVERAVKEAKTRVAGGAPAKGGKRKKAAAARRKEPIEDLAAIDGDPELYRRVAERLGLDAEEYACLDGDCRDQAQQAIKKVSTDDAEVLRYAFYGKYLMDFAQELLERRCRSGGEEDVVEETPGTSRPDAGAYAGGEVLDGAVSLVEPDGVLVSLPSGDRGVIAKGDTGVARLAVAEDGDAARIRVNGFDSESGLADREPMTREDRPRAVEPNLDDRSSPYEEYFGRKKGPKS